MIGGMRTPPVEAHASVAAANRREKPVFCMAGIENAPVVSTLEITDPDMEPMKPEAKIATLAAPPRNLPTRLKARSLKKMPPPVFCKIAPNKINPITKAPNVRMGIPNELSDEIMW